MSALIEFECRPPVGGYEIIVFDQRKGRPEKQRTWVRGPITLTPDATEDEKYMAERWGSRMMLIGDDYKPEVVHMLRPRSERVKRFNLFDRDPSVFLELAQIGGDQCPVRGKGANEGFSESVKSFADRYGLLENFRDDWMNCKINRWALHIFEMRKALIAWDKAKTTGDWRHVIRIIDRACVEEEGQRPAGVELKVCLKNDPITASARVCIRPRDLLEAIWIQLALAIDRNLNLRACVECRSWFTQEAGRGRSDKEYCSDACRMRAYRKRKGKH